MGISDELIQYYEEDEEKKKKRYPYGIESISSQLEGYVPGEEILIREEEKPSERARFSLIEKAKRGVSRAVKGVGEFLFGKPRKKFISPVPEGTIVRKPEEVKLSDEEYSKWVPKIQWALKETEEKIVKAREELTKKYEQNPLLRKQLKIRTQQMRQKYGFKPGPLVNEEIAQLEDAARMYRQFLGKESFERGFLKALWAGIKKPDETFLPFIRETKEATDLVMTKRLLDKYQDGQDLTSEEVAKVERFRAFSLNQLIKKDLGYKVGEVVTQLPAYAFEFGVTGGVFAIGQKVGLKAVSKTAIPSIAKNIVGTAVGALAQGQVFVPMMAEKTASYMLPQPDLLAGTKGDDLLGTLDKGDSFSKALKKAYLTTVIEVAIERVGGVIEDGLKFIKKATIGKWVITQGIKSSDELTRLAKKVGWNGILGEVFEEEITELAQAPIEERKFYAPLVTPEGTERLLVETLGIGAFGGIARVSDTAIQSVYRLREKRGDTPIEIPVEEKPPEEPKVPEVITEEIKKREKEEKPPEKEEPRPPEVEKKPKEGDLEILKSARSIWSFFRGQESPRKAFSTTVEKIEEVHGKDLIRDYGINSIEDLDEKLTQERIKREKQPKLTSKDFKTDMDWFNFGRKVNESWGGFIERGKGKVYPNQSETKRLADEFNTTQEVIRESLGKYLYGVKEGAKPPAKKPPTPKPPKEPEVKPPTKLVKAKIEILPDVLNKVAKYKGKTYYVVGSVPAKFSPHKVDSVSLIDKDPKTLSKKEYAAATREQIIVALDDVELFEEVEVKPTTIAEVEEISVELTEPPKFETYTKADVSKVIASKTPSDLGDMWDDIVAERERFAEPLEVSLKSMKEKLTAIKGGKREAIETRKVLRKKIEALASQLGEVEAISEDLSLEFNRKLAVGAMKEAQKLGVDLGKIGDGLEDVSEGWQEFRDDFLRTVYGRPGIETNWKIPLRVIIADMAREYGGKKEVIERVLKEPPVDKEENDAVATIKDALIQEDRAAANELYKTFSEDLTLPPLESLIDEVVEQQESALEDITNEIKTEQTKEQAANVDDPTNKLLSIADRLGKHFKAPRTLFKITGKERKYTTPEGLSLDVGGTAKQAFDRIFFATDIEGFSKNIKVFAHKFGGVFSEIDDIISKGDIDGSDYEQFKKQFRQILSERPIYAPRRGIPPKGIARQKPPEKVTRAGEEAISAAARKPPVIKPLKESLLKAPTGYATVGGFADVKSLKKSLETIRAVEFPELVRIAKELSGKTPKITTRLRTALGKFYEGDANIKLAHQIFEDPELASKVLAHEIGHLTDYLPEGTLKRGNLAGRLATLKRHLKDKFGDLSNVELREETKALTQLWHPFDETANQNYTKYRYSSKELYADAISVLFNDPALLKENAPKFWEGFFDYLDKKPKAKENFFAIWELITKGEEAILSEREKEIRDMFDKGEELYRVKVQERILRDKDFVFRLKYELIDQNQKVIDKVTALKKKGIPVADDVNPVYWLEGHNYVGGTIRNFVEKDIQPIYKEFRDSGVSWEDFGEVLFLERVIKERGKLANPLGQTPKTAQAQLDFLEKNLGPRKWEILQSNLGKFREAIKKPLDEAAEVGLYKKELIKELKANPAYATYQVLDYLDIYIPASIKHQLGTLKEIRNPATATVVKTISTIRAIERNKVKRKLVGFLKDYYPNEIKASKTRWTGRFHEPIESREVDEALFTVMEKGKFKGYYVDPYIASTMEYNSTGYNNAVLGVLKFFNGRWFRPLFITFNLGFQSFNLTRDFLRFYKNIPGMSLFRAVKRYKQAARPAFARAWDIPDKTVQEMRGEKILSVTFNDLIRGRTTHDTQIETIMDRAGLSPLKAKKRNFFVRPFSLILDTIEKTGNFIETLPKVAGYIELNGHMPSKEMASFIRTAVGSPDFLRRGAGYRWYNEVFLFSNAIKEGVRADYNVAFTNPKTRAGFWWKTAMTTFVPKMIMFAALYGLFGDIIKKMLEDVSEYDKTNYTIIPLSRENGRTTYLRIPQDETGRILGGLLWKALRIGNNNRPIMKDITDLVSYTGGQLPSISPTIETAVSTAQFLAGQNPYDFFRGRTVIPEDEFEAGGKYAFKPFAIWQLQNLGIGILWRYYVTEQTPETKTWQQKVLEAPILSNTVGRWIKISSYGQREKNRKIIEGVETEKAKKRIEERELINDYVRKYKEEGPSIFKRRSLERQLVREIVGNPPYKKERKQKATLLKKKFNIAIIKGEADQNINALISAPTNDAKLELLRSIKLSMSDSEFNELKRLLIKEKIVSKEVFKKLR